MVDTKGYFINCVLYLAIVGFGGFLVGLILPRKLFNSEIFPFKSFKFESNGRIYEKLKIRKWKDKLPDMSTFVKFMVPKTFDIASDATCLKRLIDESCVAELIHFVLIICGLYCKIIWNSSGGTILCIMWIMGNLPYIIIQRYVRPKMLKTYKKMIKYECYGKRCQKYENTNIDVQHRTGT